MVAAFLKPFETEKNTTAFDRAPSPYIRADVYYELLGDRWHVIKFALAKPFEYHRTERIIVTCNKDGV